MQPMSTIRQWQIDQLRNAINTLTFICKNIRQAEANSLRDGDEGWTVLQVVGHLRDFEAIFLERVNITLNEEHGALPFPSPEGLVEANRYNEKQLSDVLQDWTTLRLQYIAVLEGISDEADWSRTALHPTRGEFSIDDQVLLCVWHDINHFEQIAHIMLNASAS